MEGEMLRVAALQFATNCDVGKNLQTCLRMIDQAAKQRPQLMVLPEFSNHLSWYSDLDHAWSVAVEKGDDFYRAIAAKALEYHCYIVVNVSYRRVAPAITVTSLVFDPYGDCVAECDKQTLMGHENIFFVRADRVSDVIETDIGRLGIFPCRDGVTCETPRSLALRGAQLFCDSLNSFAFDEASLHVPARAAENKVFLVSANKVGPLIPLSDLTAVSQQTDIPEHFLYGAGESQIVSPQGETLARAPRKGEAVVVADIKLQPSAFDVAGHPRPDGSDWWHSRRPALYQSLVQAPTPLLMGTAEPELPVALLQPTEHLFTAIDQVTDDIARLPENCAMAVLPELFWCTDDMTPGQHRDFSRTAETRIQSILQQRADDLLVCLSVVDEAGDGVWHHKGILLGAEGRLFEQQQLHAVERLPWVTVGDELKSLQLPFARVSIMVGDDSAYPELVKVAALQGVHALLLPFRGQESWESTLGLPSRAAENRICMLASVRPESVCCGMIATLERDFTLMTPWQERTFDGYINTPLITGQKPGVTQGMIHPLAAANKVMSENTDLLLQRPWRLSGDLVAECHAFSASGAA